MKKLIASLLFVGGTIIAQEKKEINKREFLSSLSLGLRQFPNDSLLLAIKHQYLKETKINEYLKKGNRNFYKGKFDKAVSFYEKALQNGHHDLSIIQDLAVCYYQLEKFETAISRLLPIINDPTIHDGQAELILAGCYDNLRNKEKACEYFQISKNKNNIDAEKIIQKYCI